MAGVVESASLEGGRGCFVGRWKGGMRWGAPDSWRAPARAGAFRRVAAMGLAAEVSPCNNGQVTPGPSKIRGALDREGVWRGEHRMATSARGIGRGVTREGEDQHVSGESSGAVGGGELSESPRGGLGIEYRAQARPEAARQSMCCEAGGFHSRRGGCTKGKESPLDPPMRALACCRPAHTAATKSARARDPLIASSVPP